MPSQMVVTQPRPFINTSTTGEWSSDIFDCFEDLPQCCLAFWCLPCFSCKTAHEAGECACLPLLDGCGFIPPVATSLRVSIRQRYGIEGTICMDCVYSFFCPACNWCQMAREIKARSIPIISLQ
ncbi:cornifelin homolog [Clinocottus analis]|uniref:cornifelin homolog n=1 Tax=Clinocottus analis TaxID=304258 RepID=UPI0035C157D8